MAIKQKQVTIKVSEQEKRDLERLAQSQGRSMSNMIKWLVTKALRKLDKKQD